MVYNLCDIYLWGITLESRDWYILQMLYIEKNITKAANNLFISQPALTKHLQQVELD
jgi:Transcriptional regulator